MMQPGGGTMQGPMDQQQMAQSQAQWGTMAPLQLQYQQPPPPPMWSQQQPQISPQIPLQQQYPPQYHAPPPPPPQYQVTSAVQQPGSSDEIRSLWIGDLQYWMDEAYLQSCFSQPLQNGELLSMKIIRNRQTGHSEGYGFLEFATHATAERILQTYNGQMMPNIDQAYKMNWASPGAGERRDNGADHTIFVGDLASDVTDYILEETFKAVYSSVKGAKVVIDRTTGRSKGYGFVRFGDVNEQTRAMTEMNGAYCSSRPMRIGPAASKKSADAPQQYTTKASYQTQGTDSESDPNNTTIFVGGLDANVSEDLLRETFCKYGELVHVKIPVGKGCGFVQFANRANAEEALKLLHGTLLGGQNIRLSWGRSPNKQLQPDSNQWNGSHYGYGQEYDIYGYAPPPQDPNMYAYTAYQGYGNYQQ
ncbi:Apoptosis-promoting RNA-binding protein TIA-1/TIAR (RRM superfamily) protein [Dioscorea alata]|uniref:Apoptosis-promoting RNA-binding protein TIA-1/TIAR (RRM superfamily) protein n=2 Tax=Dioscorea alata TaxID=55571 RepID=A0ACB7UNX1_DIOAL|nr:Apoptosis-promoting RNA-binding protein TIA-1/TIAR (RRM superfamily) protein [Dioscorea alata]